MAWNTPMTAVAGAALTAAQWNTHVRDNLLETAPAKATNAGGLIVSAGSHEIAERFPTVATVDTSQTTTSTAFDDLTTVGPTVTVTTGTRALMLITGKLSNSTAGAESRIGVEISGASSIAPSISTALVYESGGANDALQSSYAFMRVDLVAGSNIFTCKYSVSAGTGTFLNRRLTIIPF